MSINMIVAHKEKLIEVEKGDVAHFIKTNSEGFHGFGEAYFSSIAPHNFKAWKLHKKATSNLTAVRGQIKFVVKDKENNIFKEFLLSEDDQTRLTIPPGYWYGFKNCGDEMAKVLNFMNIIHVSHEQEIVDYNFFEFNWESLK